MNDPVEVVYAAIEDVLKNAGAIWESRVYPDRAPSKKERPYAIFFIVSEIDLEEVGCPDPAIVVSVKCVANTRQQALQGKAEIAALLDDKGEQETVEGVVAGDEDWEISTISKDRGISLSEYLKGSTGAIYHAGNQYQIRLGAKTCLQ